MAYNPHTQHDNQQQQEHRGRGNGAGNTATSSEDTSMLNTQPITKVHSDGFHVLLPCKLCKHFGIPKYT
jgi:hypothetical protein